MKQIKLTTLLFGLLLFGCNQAKTSNKGQNQTNVPKDTTKGEIKDTVTPCGPDSMVWNVKQDRNGNILIASYKGVFRYDARLPDGQGKSFTNIKSKINSPSLAEFQTYL